MNKTTFSLEVFGESAVYAAYSAGKDNSAYIKHLKEILRRAVDGELTECQREAVLGVYYRNKTVTELADELGVNKSTVSRNLKRAREKLAFAMRYGAIPFYPDD